MYSHKGDEQDEVFKDVFSLPGLCFDYLAGAEPL